MAALSRVLVELRAMGRMSILYSFSSFDLTLASDL